MGKRMADQYEWATRMRQFFDTWNYDLICQEDVDKLHEHLSLTLRLRKIPEQWFISTGERIDGGGSDG